MELKAGKELVIVQCILHDRSDFQFFGSRADGSLFRWDLWYLNAMADHYKLITAPASNTMPRVLS